MEWEITYESYVFKGNYVFTLVSSVGEEIADLPNNRNRQRMAFCKTVSRVYPNSYARCFPLRRYGVLSAHAPLLSQSAGQATFKS